MPSALTYSLSGLQAASERASIRSQNIANVLTPGYQPVEPVQISTSSGPVVSARAVPLPPGGSNPDPSALAFNGSLERDLVDLTQAKHAYAASAKVIKTANELQDSLLDIIS